jgi:hypothetical protein
MHLFYLEKLPEKDELKFQLRSGCLQSFDFDFSLIIGFQKILSIKVVVFVENGIWVITKVFVQHTHTPACNPLL